MEDNEKMLKVQNGVKKVWRLPHRKTANTKMQRTSPEQKDRANVQMPTRQEVPPTDGRGPRLVSSQKETGGGVKNNTETGGGAHEL